MDSLVIEFFLPPVTVDCHMSREMRLLSKIFFTNIAFVLSYSLVFQQVLFKYVAAFVDVRAQSTLVFCSQMDLKYIANI